MPSSERLTLMLRDPERLKRILVDPERPVRLVVAGKAHPADDGGKQLVQEIVRFSADPSVRHRASTTRTAGCGAKELAAFRSLIDSAWPEVRVTHVETGNVGEAPQMGATLSVTASVELGRLSPEAVAVELAHGIADDADVLHDVQTVELEHSGGADGQHRFSGSIPLTRAGAFGYTVRVLPRHQLLASPATLGLVALPQEEVGYTQLP